MPIMNYWAFCPQLCGCMPAKEAIMSKNTYSIRHRFLAIGGEWQVIYNRKVVFRADLEDQAKKWNEEHGHETAPASARPTLRSPS